jgi:Flp pilus assembly protein TadG
MARARRRFLGNQRGNVAMLVAFSMMPITIAALGAVDVFRATSAKVQLQDALDAAALGAAKINSTTASDIQAEGMRILNANITANPDFAVGTTAFTLTSDGRVVATSSATIQPLVAGLMTGGPVSLGASSEVMRANSKVEIALVLDNTGSMAGTKLTNLKLAATNFITTMQSAQSRSIQPDAVKISLVPFSQTVRIGSTYRNSTWIDQNGASPINNEIFTNASGTYTANRFTLLTKLGTTWGGCVEARKAPYDVQDTEPVTTTPATLYTPYFAPDEPDNFTSSASPNNYLTDTNTSSNWKVRQGSIDKYVAKTGLSTSKGPNNGCSMQALQRLGQNFSTLTSTVNAMVATGDTDIPLAMAWGWNTLSPNLPFADGRAYNTDKNKKIIILMTDGENTITDNTASANRSYYSGAGYVWQGRVLQANGSPLNSTTSTQATRTAAMDSRLALICQNMKASDKDIEIYTIRVEVTSGTSTVLKNCATDSDHYFDVQNANTLNSVFQTIAGQIANLHLSK